MATGDQNASDNQECVPRCGAVAFRQNARHDGPGRRRDSLAERSPDGRALLDHLACLLQQEIRRETVQTPTGSVAYRLRSGRGCRHVTGGCRTQTGRPAA